MKTDGIESVANTEPTTTGRSETNEQKAVKPIAEPASGKTSIVPEWIRSCGVWFKAKLDWIPQNWTSSKIKTTFRCSVVAWISTVLFVIPRVEVFLGQASFLLLIAAFFSPPSDPFVSVIEREILILLFALLGWAWVCLGIFLSNLTRHVQVADVTIFQVATGQYIEAVPAVILTIFLFFGSSFFLYIRASHGPGPYLFASVFGCLCIDICFTTVILFPFPFYLIGRSIIVPLAIHTALSLLASIFIFPTTVSALFTSRLVETISPLLTSLQLHEELLSMPLSDSAFSGTLTTLRKETKKCEANLVPLAAAGRLLGSDLIYSRFAPADFRAFQAIFGKLAARADGMATYFTLVDPNRESFLGATDKSTNETPIPTVPSTPQRRMSREASLEPSNGDPYRHSVDRPGLPSSSSMSSIHTPTASTPAAKRGHSTHSHTHSHSRRVSPWNPLSSGFHGHPHAHAPENHHHHHPDLLHHSLLSLAKTRSRRREHAVGVFETQKYLDFEFTRFHDPDECSYTEQLNDLLNECSTPLLVATRGGLSVVSEWLQNVYSGRFSYILNAKVISWLGKRTADSEDARKRTHNEQIANIKTVREELATTLQVFRDETRHCVLNLYRPCFENPTAPNAPTEPSGEFDKPQNEDKDAAQLGKKAPPHRHLFHCYIYQYHLIFLATDVIEMVDEILRLEEARPWPKCSLWTPVETVFRWNSTLFPDRHQLVDDDDPDVIQSLGEERRNNSNLSPGSLEDSDSLVENDLGMPHKRDPDALPPRNFLETFFNMLYYFFHGLGGGNVVFALKAGLLTVVLSLPLLIKSSARFAYENRAVWAIFMGQLTLSRFRGDTVSALIARLISTFVGGIIGLVMWYVSAGSGDGNPYGFAAVCAVCFPFFLFARLYWPIPPMINLILWVTVLLVIGYSYQDSILHLPGSPGAGFTVAWRRFVLVSIGVFAAFVASMLPPSTTIRKYQRSLLSTTSAQLGAIYCSILTFANTKKEPEIQEIISSLVALRNKLNKSTELRANVGYEFDLRGRWPKDRYQKIADLQTAIAYSLSNLISVIDHLEPSWALAFLRRTRFMDPDFQGDLLAVLSMISSSLRTGCPLPQITPCPLVDRFTLKYHGLNVIHKDAEEDYGIPRTLTIDLLKNEQYLMFCVGISTAFGFVNRLDRLMMAVKEVVGEQYHIHGIGVPTNRQSRSYVTPAVSMKVVHGPRDSEAGEKEDEIV